jgi:hypothetical protein
LKNGVSGRDPALRGSGEHLQESAGTTIEALPCFLSFRPQAERGLKNSRHRRFSDFGGFF